MPKSVAGFLEWSLLIVLALIWGSSFILMKYGLLVYSPGQVAALRMFIASLCLFPLVVTRIREVRPEQWKFLAASGFLGNGIPAILFALAQTRVNSSVAGILNSLTPVFVLLVSVFIFRNTVKTVHLIGILLGFAGAVTILLFRSGGGFEGNFGYGLLIVAATVCYAFSINIIKNYLNEMPSLLISGMAVTLSGIPYGIYLFCTDFTERLAVGGPAYTSLLAIAILGVFGTALSLILFNKLIKTSSVLFTSSVTYLIPVVALFWGFSDHESLGVFHVAGLVAILAGVYLVNRK